MALEYIKSVVIAIPLGEREKQSLALNVEIVQLYGIPSGLRPDFVVTRNDTALFFTTQNSTVIARSPNGTTKQSFSYTVGIASA